MHKDLNLYTEKKFNDSNTDSSFIAYSNLFLSPLQILPIAQENIYIWHFFIRYHENMCGVYSLESHHRGDSNEYTQYTVFFSYHENMCCVNSL